MTATPSDGPLPGSFRDPSGFVFRRHGILYRQINPAYRDDYDHLLQSGLYRALTEASLLVAHEETEIAGTQPCYKVVRPAVVPFVSYPYEWSFSQWKDAALLTLDVQEKAFAHGMMLKDASAFNVQFVGARPVFIDTLSFARYREGQAWDAYGQFCRHFLAPLALMSTRDVRLGQLMRVHLDGVPLDLAARLLPLSAKLRPSLAMHVVLHARAQTAYAGHGTGAVQTLSKSALLGILSSLRAAVAGLAWTPGKTAWSDYTAANNYTDAAKAHKLAAVRRFIERAAPGSVWDFGANTGAFARVATGLGIPAVCFDQDAAVTELNYLAAKAQAGAPILPLTLDLCNPSPALGWANAERDALAGRGRAGLGLALALIHHLAIAGNVPLPKIAAWFRPLCDYLVVEFVPKEDSQVQRLLASRPDIFADYHEAGFRAAFEAHFEILDSVALPESARTLYLLRARPA
jgi:ribosomal protein L11 methylase PrmA